LHIALAKHAPAALILNAVGAFFFGETLVPLTPEGNVCRSRFEGPVSELPTRSVIGLDAHVSQPIADTSDDTGRTPSAPHPDIRPRHRRPPIPRDRLRPPVATLLGAESALFPRFTRPFPSLFSPVLLPCVPILQSMRKWYDTNPA
jgi:hypothetical protein